MQSALDTRQIAINRVGIRAMRHPIKMRSMDGSGVATVALVDMAVGLAAIQKGTHMSRFVELMHSHGNEIDTQSFADLFERMLSKLEASTGLLSLKFPYFYSKHAPVSGAASLMDVDVVLTREKKQADSAVEYTIEVAVPVTSLCPCSKEISDFGAHNQRSTVVIRVLVAAPLPVLELIQIAERAASCELFGILKRPDEKWVTERAYDNPKFVEDLVRDIAVALNAEERIAAYTVSSENFESIHNHSAYAVIEHDKRDRASALTQASSGR